MKVAHVCDDEKRTVMFNCPGCGTFHGATTEGKNGSGAQWSFNGSEESPTLSPSLLVKWLRSDGSTVQGVCHSFVRNGSIEFLSDCTHSLAGQTVPLPPWEDES